MSEINMAHVASNVYDITEIDTIYINSSLQLNKCFSVVTFRDNKPSFVTEMMAAPHLKPPRLQVLQSSTVTTLIT